MGSESPLRRGNLILKMRGGGGPESNCLGGCAWGLPLPLHLEFKLLTHPGPQSPRQNLACANHLGLELSPLCFLSCPPPGSPPWGSLPSSSASLGSSPSGGWLSLPHWSVLLLKSGLWPSWSLPRPQHRAGQALRRSPVHIYLRNESSPVPHGCIGSRNFSGPLSAFAIAPIRGERW